MNAKQLEIFNKLGLVKIDSKVQYFTKEQLIKQGIREEQLNRLENKCIVSFSCINIKEETNTIEKLLNYSTSYSSYFLEFKKLIIEYNDNLFLSKEEKQKIIDEYKLTNSI